MTEDKTVLALIKHLKQEGWHIENYCIGHQRGDDIVATKRKSKIVIEVKGARANPNSPVKKREKFDSGQIKTHLGKAILKSYDSIISNENNIVAIAHPNDGYLKSVISKYIPLISNSGIRHYWVNEDGTVEVTLEKLLLS